MARAVRIAQFGGPEVLTVIEIEDPVPGPGQVVVQVHAAGVNPVDWKIRAGARSTGPLTEPRGLGSDASGVIIATAPDVRDFRVGDEVIGRGLDGAYATRVLATADQLTRKPAALGWPEAASLGVPVGTAYQVLRSLGLKAGDVLLVHAGSGGVGQAAIQLARHWGATVIATASEPNHDRLRELDATPVSYGPGLLERVRHAAPSGVDVVLDAAGTQEAIEVSLALVPDRARIATIVTMDWVAEYGIQGWSNSRPGFMTPETQALRVEAIGYVADLAEKGEFDVEIAASYPLERVADAHRQSETGHVRGKIVLVP